MYIYALYSEVYCDLAVLSCIVCRQGSIRSGGLSPMAIRSFPNLEASKLR